MLSTLIRHRPATVLGTAPAALLAASSSSTSSLSRPVLLPQFRASSTFSSTAWSLAVSRHAPGPPLSRRRRSLHDSARLGHENPLGIPRREANPAPKLPRRGGPPERSRIRGVQNIIVVASGKGGVGKSTVAANLALALANTSPLGRAPRIGLLDLDIFGPSVPMLMGLDKAGEPAMTDKNKLVPLQNHGIKTMSIGYLLPPDPNTPVVWRGLMVQKAVQQLLFDVEWTDAAGDLDVLVIDMPPGTGDVQLSLGQLVVVDGAVIVSTPQDVALIDARKGVAMFNKVNVPITGLLLNMSHFTCNACTTPHELFGSADKFTAAANELGLDVLGKVPLVTSVSDGGDAGRPVMTQASPEGEEVRGVMKAVAARVWDYLASKPRDATVGSRG